MASLIFLQSYDPMILEKLEKAGLLEKAILLEKLEKAGLLEKREKLYKQNFRFGL